MTLDSQLPRSSFAAASLFGSNRRKMIPIALAIVGAASVACATFYFTQVDETPTAARVPINAVPEVVVAAPEAPRKPQEKQAIPSPGGPKQVAMTVPAPIVSPARAVTPSATVPAEALPARTASAPATMNLATAMAMTQADPVGARLALTRLIDRREIAPADLPAVMNAIREVNAQLFFSPTVVAGDPVTRSYTVKSGDTLSRIAKRNDVQTDWRVIQRINGMKSEKSLRVGQNLKIPVGAFHAEISKSDYQMRIYAGEGSARVIVAILQVGLGELNSTPTGAFMVRPKSKLINPEWNNPRTGEHFASDDPKNPIGEHWIGLIGVEAHNQGFKGYGIHGTIDAGSIGNQASMGCVRMNDPDVELVYELLTEPNSTIVIAP